MSFSVYVNCPTCGSAVLTGDYGSNRRGIWRTLGFDISKYEGKKNVKALPEVQAALNHFSSLVETQDLPGFLVEKFKSEVSTQQMFDAVNALQKIRDAMALVPEGTFTVYG